MTEPSRKRPRHDTELPTALPSGATKKDDEFWFDDGNLTIVAQDVEFRVYRGPIIKQSPVFRDMLTLPQPADASELGAHPVVPIPEHPSSFRHLLREFMAGSAFQSPHDTSAFDVVAAVIRLGHKYEIDWMVKKGLEYLKRRYPDDYLRWSLQATDPTVRFDDPSVFARSISVVNLARLTDTPSLLRPAFLLCCMMDPHVLMQGYQREDGTCERLSADDLTRVLLARTELVRLDALAAIRIFQDVSTDCVDVDGCTQCCLQALRELLDPVSPARTFNPPRRPTWHQYASDIGDGGDSFCDACLAEIRSVEYRERLSMWNSLPAILDIPEPQLSVPF
ncbi:hypothetical protein C8T65DRAFT_577234 [Cerioporus squamosus]|nr:hypothetical protein C8T65DRAFT_577234 [Cerioporus squamosus]